MSENALPKNVNCKIERYLKIFEQMYPDKDITDKSYDVTLVRSLIMYFLYQEKVVYNIKSINYQSISDYFGLKTHATALKAVHEVENYLLKKNNSKSLETKELFSHFHYRFQLVFKTNHA